MNILKYPSKTEWPQIVQRPHSDIMELRKTVQTVLDDVRENGDEAIFKYEAKFDHVTLHSLTVSEEELKEADSLISKELKDSLLLAHRNISKFHESQRFESKHIETAPGVECWQKSIAIEKVGLYIPGGTAPLFSTVLMLATPAKIAGCKEIILCTPPNHEGKIHPAILVAARIAGVNKIFKIGGIQAIGAMAYGTQSVPKVYKIFGPGNQYVMTAKQMISIHGVAIDMPAGPSEVCVIADQYSSPEYIAADLLSQAEHGIDSQVLLICTSASIINLVQHEVEKQLATLPRRDIASKALNNSKIVLVKDIDEAIELSNVYAPEHLILEIDQWEAVVDKIVNAGSVFLGKWACESAGDYASGTNHTLPTHGYAVAYSGVNLDSYTRKITFQHLTEEGIRSIGQTVVTMAVDEQLEAHANAMRIRLNDINRATNGTIT